MKTYKIPYQDIRFFSKLIGDYIQDEDVLKDLHSGFPDMDAFEDQIKIKKQSYHKTHREVLVQALKDQYSGIENSENTLRNIEKLMSPSTFTITTGHQLNLFTGPLYFLYKIISVLNLCKQLKTQYPQHDFVPIYWMASEDHDFDEIKFFNTSQQTISWDASVSGAVGPLQTTGLDAVLGQLQQLWGNTLRGKELIDLFKKSYLDQQDLAAATRVLAHQLFGDYGLVIIDANNAQLKSLVAPYFKDELLRQSSYHAVQNRLEKWPSKYKVQVNPREINLFYIKDDIRERIVQHGDLYRVVNTDLQFTQEQIVNELHEHPERFSPNVILRPFYQEVILPNLCYVGGGGEMAYWLELKDYFDTQKVPFPLLLPRNSVLLMTQKQLGKLQKLSIEVADLFLTPQELETKMVQDLSTIPIDFTPQIDHLKSQFESLHELAHNTHPSFKNAVAAQEQKQIKGLLTLEKRLLKAQKSKLKDHTSRALLIQQELFPSANLQERKENFSTFYLQEGSNLVHMLVQQLDPLDLRFTVLVIDQ